MQVRSRHQLCYIDLKTDILYRPDRKFEARNSSSNKSGYFWNMAHYQAISETKADLPWASLVTLDLSEFDQPGGKAKLAAQLKEAIHKIGFFYIINHGISQKDIDDQLELASAIFSLSHEEKMKCAVNSALPGG